VVGSDSAQHGKLLLRVVVEKPDHPASWQGHDVATCEAADARLLSLIVDDAAAGGA
jgi:hypothetical protein